MIPVVPTIDPAALEAKAHGDLGWAPLLEQLAARAHTTRGQTAARALSPSRDAGWVRGRLTEISEARSLHDRGVPMAFGGVTDVEEHLGRAEKGGHLDGHALRAISATLDGGRRLRRGLLAGLRTAPAPGERAPAGAADKVALPRLAVRAALLAELPDVSGPIDDAFDDQGQLLDTASPALGPLRRKAAHLREELDHRAHALLDHPAFAPHLQDRFYTRRDDRFVLPIRTDARTRVKGIVHGSSGSGQTVFVEPEEIVDLNNRLKLAEIEVADEERRILGELSLLVQDAVRPIRVNLEVLADLDLIDAGARLAIDLRAQEPIVSDGETAASAIDLRNARHPLMVLTGRECVPNDLLLRRGRTLVISGPNAGGKTVALKTAGLLSLMVRAGLHLPTQEGSSLALFPTVLTDVGDDQSLERDLSTFSAHVLHLNAFLAAASPDALILLDEVAVGTDPDQGAALAQSVLEALADRGATVIVTTHYERLKALPARDPRFANASVGFDLERLAPTFQLHLGVPGASGAIPVARRLGLPAAIADRAQVLLGSASHGVDELLAQVDGERKRLQAAASAAEEEREAAVAEHRRAEAVAAEAETRLKAARKAEHDEAVEALKRARLDLDRTRALLKKGGASKEALEQAEREIDRSAKQLATHAPAPAPPQGRAATAADLFPGAEVLVPRLGGRGLVTAAPRGGRVAVQVGALKLTVDESELLVPARGAAPAAGRSAPRPAEPFERGAPGGGSDAMRTTSNSLDLRGERVDVALALTEKFLDEALRIGNDVVFLIHGHGTGALRAALREHLGQVPGVSALRPGEPSEGGDGVTVVTLS